MNKPYVCTYLFDLKFTDLTDPWAQFQGTVAKRDDTLKLMQTINTALGDDALKDNDLVAAFDKWWDELNTELTKVPAYKWESKPQRDQQDMVEEILALVREVRRSVAVLSASVSVPRTGFASLLGGGPSDVGGGTAAFRPQDLLRTLVSQPTPEGDLERTLEKYRESEPIASALLQLTKAIEKRVKAEHTQEPSPGERGEAAT